MSKFLRPLVRLERELCKITARNVTSSNVRGVIPTSLLLSRRITTSIGPGRQTSQFTQTRSSSTEASPSVMTEVTSHDVLRLVEVGWKDGVTNHYPYTWLRDSCRCSQCYLDSSKSRLIAMHTWKINTKPTDIQVDDKLDEMKIIWDDGHVGFYKLSWLRKKQFTPEARLERRKMLPLQPQPWGRRDMQNNIPTDTFHNIMTDDKALLGWIENMERKGLFIIKETPTELGQLPLFGDRIAYLRRTNYRKEFTVKAQVKANNHAYTSALLGLHTDLADLQYTPGIQMLHCIQQVPTKGGGNTFADGFYVAEILKKQRPDLYKVLTLTTLEFRDIGEQDFKFHSIGRHKTIKFNDLGDYERVTFNNQSRDYFMNLPLEQVNTVYEAIHAYNDLFYDEDNHIKFKLKPGEVVCFHNHRVLHGREAFQVLEEGERHLEGCFLDWDDVHSRRRVILYQQGLV